jgi:hypothetical protein
VARVESLLLATAASAATARDVDGTRTTMASL